MTLALPTSLHSGEKTASFQRTQNRALHKPQGHGLGTARAEENPGLEKGAVSSEEGGTRRPTLQEPVGGTRRGDGPRAGAARGRGRETGTPRLLRGPASAPPPPVPFARGTQAKTRGEGERESQKKGGGGGAGVFLSGAGGRRERGHRSAQLFLRPPSRPFSPCLRAGIAPWPRRWSTRTVGPSGQRPGNRARAQQGGEWCAGEAGAGEPAL